MGCCCAFLDAQSAHHGILFAFQLAEMKTKLDMSERRVSELEEERHQHPPEKERLQVLGRDRLSQEMVGGCAVTQWLSSLFY